MRKGICFIRFVLAIIGVVACLYGCTDNLVDVSVHVRPSEVICFTASLSDGRPSSVSRSASGHLAIEQEEWLYGSEQHVSRGKPVTLLSGSAGIVGYVYDSWSSSITPWDSLYNKKFNFDGDALTAASNDVRWQSIVQASNNSNVLFHAYAPYNLSGGTLSGSSVGDSLTLDYTVNRYAKDQHDLIVSSWAGKKGINYGEDSQNNDIQPLSIPLTFEHALTGVKFKVGFACTVIRLDVQGIYHSGIYTFGGGWNVKTDIPDSVRDYTFTFGGGKSFAANAALTEGDSTLMMIPQMLGSEAKVVLTYREGSDSTPKTITASLADKIWEAGKMITYTIHKTSAPTTIYFDLTANNVNIGKEATSEDVSLYKEKYINDLKVGELIYVGSIYVGGQKTLVVGRHNTNNHYYVYQSSTNTSSLYNQFNAANTGYANNADYNDKSDCRIPAYSSITYDGKLWSDYITNNTSVEDVIEIWDNGKNVRTDNTDAPDENHTDIAVVREVGRTHTRNYIIVEGYDTKYNLTIDNIYSVIQEPVNSGQKFRSRSKGGIAYMPNRLKGKTNLTVNFVGDNRMGCLHIANTPTDTINLQGTGSLTVADTDFLTVKCVGGYATDFGDTKGYISNFWNSAIGNNTEDPSSEGAKQYNENVYNLYINSGVIFAGTTKTEDCSAIGGGGNGDGHIYITGGIVTAVATTAGTAIGGGMGHTAAGGPGYVHISGGNIYAYNFANQWRIPSSAIGGGSSQSADGREGVVEITGGYVYAYSALGTAIGGGSSKIKQGGNANVIFTGGQIIAKSGAGAGIGGGSSCTGGGTSGTIYNGGTATIKITGNPIIRTGSIGGGVTGHPAGKIGHANITVAGGDIQAQFVMEAGSTGTPTFSMSAGTIRNSYVSDEDYIHIKKKGGAVYLEDGVFTMTGGTIKNCSAEQGGAVYIERKSAEPMGDDEYNLVISDSANIHSCFATGMVSSSGEVTLPGHGGAVCLNGGQVKMNGGKISNNYSENGDGGAVYVSNGNFFMMENLPEISGNSAQKGNGGGVFVTSEKNNTIVKLLNGVISGNTSNNYGGGVCVDMGDTGNAATVTVGVSGQGATKADADPRISGNMSVMSGGGLYVRGANALVTIHSGMIDENNVSAYVKNDDVANHLGEVVLEKGQVPHVLVTFVGNGGTVTGGSASYTQNIVTDTNSKLMPNSFVLGGHNFNGWNTRADGLGTPYTDRAFVNTSVAITLYAQWKSQTGSAQ